MAKGRSARKARVSCQQLGSVGGRGVPACSGQTISVMNFDLDARCLPETLVRRCQTRRKGVEKPRLDRGQPSWRGAVCEASGACPGAGGWGRLLAPRSAFLLSHVAIARGARPGTKQVGNAHVNCCTTERLETSHVLRVGNVAVSILPSCGRATRKEEQPLLKQNQ